MTALTEREGAATAAPKPLLEAGILGADPADANKYLHARYYDPALGVFVSSDPSHPTQRGVGLNRYGYSFGNPINSLDRNGLDCRTTYEGTDVSGNTWKSWRSDPGNCGNLIRDLASFYYFGYTLLNLGAMLDDPVERERRGSGRPTEPPKTPEPPTEGPTCQSANCEPDPDPDPNPDPQSADAAAATPQKPPPIDPPDVDVNKYRIRAIRDAGIGWALDFAANRLPCGKPRAALRGASGVMSALGGIEAGAAAIGSGYVTIASAETVVGGLLGLGSTAIFGAVSYASITSAQASFYAAGTDWWTCK